MSEIEEYTIKITAEQANHLRIILNAETTYTDTCSDTCSVILNQIDEGLVKWRILREKVSKKSVFKKFLFNLCKGNAILAIKLYKEVTGSGLKEAKDAIDYLRAGDESKFNQHFDGLMSNGITKIENISIVERLHGYDFKKVPEQYKTFNLGTP